MKKEEFLTELEQRLDILNDSEKQDIIGEYSQHIDLKMENGLSEEAAAGDFGDIRELADEILSAYHVNLEYNRTKTAAGIKKTLVKGFTFMLERWEAGEALAVTFLKRCGTGIFHAGKAVLECYRRGMEKMGRLFAAKGSRISGAKELPDSSEAEEIKETLQEDRTDRNTAEEALDMGQGRLKVTGGRTLGGMVKTMLKGLSCFISKAVQCLIFFCIVCAAIPFMACGLMGLLMLGFFLMLIPQGYPVVGISVMVAGGCMIAAAVTGVLLSFWSDVLDREIEREEVQR